MRRWVTAAAAAALLAAAAPAPAALPAGFYRGAMCIHRHEGSWRDSGGPYYGGMQMDWRFMSTYGPRLLRRKGTADHWTPHEQLVVSYRAYRSRGWWPWPRSARICGLL